MDKRLEQIAINYISVASKENSFANVANSLRDILDYGEELNSLIDIKYSELSRDFEQKKDEFWEAFKYPLQIFDLKKGEVPNVGDKNISVYDEIDECWINNVGLTAQRGFEEFTEVLHILEIERYHRWTRLPMLDEENNENKQS